MVVKIPKNANNVWLMAKTETIQYKFWIFLSQTVIKANLETEKNFSLNKVYIKNGNILDDFNRKMLCVRSQKLFTWAHFEFR